jgi:hypothetical protein
MAKLSIGNWIGKVCQNGTSGRRKKWDDWVAIDRLRVLVELDEVTILLCKALFVLDDVCQFPDDPEMKKWWEKHRKFDHPHEDS